MQDSGPSFRILLICTGNLFRSPAAEHLLRRRLPERLGIEISSAGSQARPGRPIADAMAALLAESDIASGGFQSSPLSDAGIEAADLILGLEQAHRSAAVSRVPSALGRSFTLKEFDRLTASLPATSLVREARRLHPASRLELLVREAADRRGSFRPQDDDIPDPIGEPESVVRSVFGEIRTCVDDIAERVLDSRGDEARKGGST